MPQGSIPGPLVFINNPTDLVNFPRKILNADDLDTTVFAKLRHPFYNCKP